MSRFNDEAELRSLKRMLISSIESFNGLTETAESYEDAIESFHQAADAFVDLMDDRFRKLEMDEESGG